MRLELSDGQSHKFWEIDREGAVVTARWGRIGSKGQVKTTSLDDEAAADAAMAKQIAAKRRKGYAAPGAPTTPEAPAAGGVGAPPADLADGQEAEVPGSGGRTYTVRHVGGVFSCSCPAWRNQSLPIAQRSCKHLRLLRGDAVETARVGAAPVRVPAASGEGPPLLLAERFDPAVHDPVGWWMSEKLDGVRALWDGTTFWSRLGNVFQAPEWFTANLPDTPLDGELFAGRGAFHRAVSIARRVDGGEAWRELRFLVFDSPQHDAPFEARLHHLERLACHWGEHAALVEHVPCTGLEALRAEMDRILGLDGEGLMLRQPGSRYVAGRSETLLKVKRFHDVEARVTEHLPGTGRHEGRLGALRVVLADGTTFKVGTGFTDALREDPPDVGAIVTVRYQERTRAGVPRFPIFVRIRPDLDALPD